MPTLTLAAGAEGVAWTVMGVLALGVGAQWLAWRVRLPSILLLLLSGFAVGPGWSLVSGGEPLLDPDALFGDLLLPLVSVSVGLILYEGGLTLRWKEIKGVRHVVTMLVTAGALATCAVAAAGAKWVLDLPTSLAVLFGALLVVTGPTVIIPMLAHVRPAGRVGPILKWEGIVIDPIGALAAVLVLEVILIGDATRATGEILTALIKTVVVGGGLGLFGAVLLRILIQRFWAPEGLQNPLSLALVAVTFTLSNQIQHESGLLATTVMGIYLANQSRVDVRHILEFKENLRVLLIAVLFIVLAARVSVEDLQGLAWGRVLGFIALLILVARPLTVLVSTWGEGLSWRERVFLCFLAPRGIVAAAVASVFALTLDQAVSEGRLDIDDPGRLVPLTFSVIVGTVLFYGLTAGRVARWLGVSDQNPQGLLIVGASPPARAIAAALDQAKVRVLLVDANRNNISAARMQGLDAVIGNVLEEAFIEELDLRGIGRALAMTPNEEVNTLALQRFAQQFGKQGVYRLPRRAKNLTKSAAKPAPPAQTPPTKKPGETGPAATPQPAASEGRLAFTNDCDFIALSERLRTGWITKVTRLTEEFDFRRWVTLYGGASTPLFIAKPDGAVEVVTADKRLRAESGDSIVALVNPDELLMPAMFDIDEPETPANGGAVKA